MTNPEVSELLAKRNKLTALEGLLHGEPLYPEGTVVRQMQDERDELLAFFRARSESKS